MLTKSQLANEIADLVGDEKKFVISILDGLGKIAQRELESGEDFSVPGVARITWRFRKPQAKGARWKAGETVVGFGGIASVKDADSPEVKAQVRLAASLGAALKGLAPKTKDRPAQTKFLNSKAGKGIAARKG